MSAGFLGRMNFGGQKPLFSDEKEQVQRVMQLNEVVWKDPAITEKEAKKHLQRAAGKIEEIKKAHEQSSCFAFITLFREARNFITTLQDNWNALRFMLGEGTVKMGNGLDITEGCFRLRSGAQKRPQGLWCGLCTIDESHKTIPEIWQTLDAQGIIGMGPEVLAILAMHPRYAYALGLYLFGYSSLPLIDVEARRIEDEEKELFYRLPVVGYDAFSHEMFLVAGWGFGHPSDNMTAEVGSPQLPMNTIRPL